MNNGKKIIQLIFFICLISLLVYAFWLNKDIYESLVESNHQLFQAAEKQANLTRTYTHLYHETQTELASATNELNLAKQKYQDSQDMLAGVSRDLENTRKALSQASIMLGEATQGKVELPPDLLALTKVNSSVNVELENSIAVLREKNDQLNKEMQELQNQLRQLSGDVNNLEEGKMVLNNLYTRVKTVKGKISTYRRQAEDVRIAALKERDKIRSMLGNRGFLVKDGRIVKVDRKNYESASLESLPETDEITSKNRKMRIDVTFVK